MSHLTPAELVDAAEGVLDASRQEHLDRCDRCRVELNALAEVLRDLPAAPVPEPSPLFCEHFATRVRDAIAAEQRERQRTMSWDGIRWSALVPLGAFAVVIEGTVEPVAREVTEKIAIPTIGIGASPVCDGQILVIDDLVGMFTDFTPKFVKRYADLGTEMQRAAAAFAADVRARRFPEPAQCFGVKAPAAAE